MVPPSAGDTVPPVRCISARTHAWHREAYSSSYISHNNAYHVFTLTGATINTTTMRDQLCCDGCFLHCGQLSPRAVWPRVRTQIQHSPRGPFTVYSFQANEGFLNEGRGGAVRREGGESTTQTLNVDTHVLPPPLVHPLTFLNRRAPEWYRTPYHGLTLPWLGTREELCPRPPSLSLIFNPLFPTLLPNPGLNILWHRVFVRSVNLPRPQKVIIFLDRLPTGK